jgi:hypothetical protein
MPPRVATITTVSSRNWGPGVRTGSTNTPMGGVKRQLTPPRCRHRSPKGDRAGYGGQPEVGIADQVVDHPARAFAAPVLHPPFFTGDEQDLLERWELAIVIELATPIVQRGPRRQHLDDQLGLGDVAARKIGGGAGYRQIELVEAVVPIRQPDPELAKHTTRWLKLVADADRQVGDDRRMGLPRRRHRYDPTVDQLVATVRAVVPGQELLHVQRSSAGSAIAPLSSAHTRRSYSMPSSIARTKRACRAARLPEAASWLRSAAAGGGRA